MKEKVCLIIPPSIFLLDERVFTNLGILKVASALEEKGHPVEVLDLSGITNFVEVADLHSRSTDAKWFGITTTTPQMPPTAKIARAVRKARPDAKLVIGGPHPTLVNAALKREKRLGIHGRATVAMEQLEQQFDVVVAGDGELSIFEALKLESGIVDADDSKGPLFLTNASYEGTPLPARHLVDLSSYHYTIEGHRATSLIAQLGCPFACFAPYTKIITSEGKNKRADEVEVGDKLLAIDEKTKEIVSTTVTKKFVHEAHDLYRIKFHGSKKFVDVTLEHPFYVNEKWVTVSDLRPGDEIFDIDWKDANRARMRLGNPVKNSLVKQKISKSVKKCFEEGRLSSEHLPKNSVGRKKVNDGIRRFWNSESCRNLKKRLSHRMSENNPMFDEEIAARAAETFRRRVELGEYQYFMRTPEYWEKLKCSPNNQEKKFLDVLTSEFGSRYEFVGDGSFRIGFYAPDFIDRKNKKIIEYYGCWWHGCEQCFPDQQSSRKRDEDRIKKFEEAGFKVKIIWSHEMDDEDRVLGQLRQFTYNGAKIKSITKLEKKETVYNFECSPHHNYFAEYLLSHNCGFCGGRESSMLRKIRTRSTQSIVQEVEMLHRTYGYTGFMFYDDELNVSKSMVELMDSLTDLQMKLGTEFRLRGFVKSELFTERQAQAMRRAGFRWVLTGFEAANPRILKNINKKATLEENTECVEIAKKNDLKVKALMSIGHPGESEKTVRDVEDWLLKMEPEDFDVTIITTYPGTPYYDHAVESSPNIWTYSVPANGDRLHAYQIDYNEVADYYKGDPDGGYKAYVYTDFLTSDELVSLRGSVEKNVREKLGIPFNPGQSPTNYEHSMGQGQLPANILRSSDSSSSMKKNRKLLPVIR